MASFSFLLLGGFHVERDGAVIDAFESNKVRALLAYLAVEADRAHLRSGLAALLWPDHPEEMARTNLRHVLRQLRKTLSDPDPATPLLLTTRQTVELNPALALTVDVTRFAELLAACAQHRHPNPCVCSECIQRYRQAADLYRGDFLAGLSFYGSEPFEEWAVVQRQHLHRQALETFFILAAYHEGRGEYDQAQHHARRQLALEPWREKAHRQLMRVLALNGQRSAALAQFGLCRKILADELDIEPEAETLALYEQIRSGKFDSERGGKRQGIDRLPAIQNPKSKTQNFQDWGEAPANTYFCGREAELEQLRWWLLGDPAGEEPRQPMRLITVLALGGMGKTALTARSARLLAEEFEFVFWRSLLNAPPLPEVLRDALGFLSRQQLTNMPEHLGEQITVLISYLRQHRCLLVLDNVESVLEAGQAGQYSPGYEAYGHLIERVAQREHQSCLVLTSRERPHGLEQMEEDLPWVRTLSLGGLTAEAGAALLKTHGIAQQAGLVKEMVQRYSGNPLALKLVARTAQELFAGDIGAFLSEEVLIFDDIRTVLDQQFARLTRPEREILITVALAREGVSAQDITENSLQTFSQRYLLEALRALQRRSLLEKTKAGLVLQNVVIEYVTEHIIHQACAELEQGTPGLLSQHPLLRTQAKEYIRQSQSRLILQPIVDRLIGRWGRTELEVRCQQLLATLREKFPLNPGYAAGNLLNLLLQMETDLRGYDFSRLSIWQAYLRGKRLPQVNFSAAAFRQSVFTDAFGLVGAVAISPPTGESRASTGNKGESLLAAGTSTGEVYLWQTSTGNSAALFKGDPQFVWTVAFSQDGQLIASGGEGQRIWLWHVPTAKVSHILAGHTGTVRAVLFSPDGQTLISGSDDQTVRLWDVGEPSRRGQLRRTLVGHTNRVWGLALSSDGQMLASCGDDQQICLWDVREPSGRGQLRYTLAGQRAGIRAVAFRADGKILASGGDDHKIRLWEVSTGQLLQVLEGHTNLILSLAFSPAQNMLASGSADQTVRLWDSDSGRIYRTLSGHTSYVWDVAFSSDGQTLASGGGDQSVRVWDVGEPAGPGLLLSTLRGYSRRHNAVAFHPTGGLVASGGADQMVRVWDLSSGQPRRSLAGHGNWLWSVAFSPDGRILASSSADRTVRLWDATTGQLLHILHGHTAQVRAVAFSPDGRFLASGSDDQTIRLWDVATGQPRSILKGHESWVWGIAFHPDDQTLASSSGDQTVRLWDWQNGTLDTTLRGHSNRVWGIAVSPDGRLLASGSDDQTVRIWDAQSGQLLQILQGHDSVVWSVAFSPDSQLLASGSGDRTIRLWDMQTGEARSLLHGHTNWVLAVAFSPDGHHLVSGSADETIRLWDVQTAACRQTLAADGPYAGMNIRDATGISDARRVALKMLGAVER